jgi:predicted RecB family nuclease
MSRTITSEILVAYSQCPRKAFLLLCTSERGTPHEYTEILEKQRQINQRKYLDILRRKNVNVQSYSPDNLKNKHEFLTNATLRANGLAAECAILSKVRTHSTLGHYSYEPTIFVGTYSIKKEHKLELCFVSYVLEQVQNKRPVSGRIIGLDDKSHKVKLENGLRTLLPSLEPLQEWAATPSPEPPSLILNKHCSICQFRNLCRAKAEKEDNLSLLDGISTPKAVNKYEKKGLFTVKQLSYTFKPRKRKKRAKNPPPVIHKPELQALAIREGKIYLQELPELTRQPVELFLDIEGVPDRQLYYLIGLLVSENDTTTYHPFWADTPADEAQMWRQFLTQVSQYPEAPIYHYGSFEPRTLAKLAKRYDTDGDSLTKQLVNVNNHVYGKIYFPIYSNRLKEIGAFIGVTWTSSNASGLQSLVWRHHWDKTRGGEYKGLLLAYNEEDCRALKFLTDELSKIRYSADTLSEVDFANQPKRRATEAGEEVHSQFEELLKFAHTNYDKTKINFRLHTQDDGKAGNEKKKELRKRHQQKGKKRPKPGKVVQVAQRRVCPIHKNESLIPTKQISERLIIDVVLMKNCRGQEHFAH